MAKNPPPKNASKPESQASEASQTVAEVPVSPVADATTVPAPAETVGTGSKSGNSPVNMNQAKKEPPAPKPKKPVTASGKPGSMLPSAHKLEALKAAVSAAGGAENLLTILQHVDDAGGRTEVADSIEAYRVLKTVLEE